MQYSFTAKMTVDVYSKATIPAKSNTLQKFRTLVQCVDMENTTTIDVVAFLDQTKRILDMKRNGYTKTKESSPYLEVFWVIGC
jgi:hypothetical protein